MVDIACGARDARDRNQRTERRRNAGGSSEDIEEMNGNGGRRVKLRRDNYLLIALYLARPRNLLRPPKRPPFVLANERTIQFPTWPIVGIPRASERPPLALEELRENRR